MGDPAIAAALANAGFVPAEEVIKELTASPLPREAKACLAALSTETLFGNPPSWPYDWSPFRCEFGFKEWQGSLDTFPDWGGNDQFKTHAIGVWQDQPETYARIAAKTGITGFHPQDQIRNNWVLAVDDYHRRTSAGSLLTALRTGREETVSPALISTWPGGANAGFANRYRAALAMFPVEEPEPAPEPFPPPTPTPPSVTGLAIPLGERCTIAILAATDTAGDPITDIPADLMVPDDPTICSATIIGMSLMIDSLAIGGTILRGADQVVTISVVARSVAHLELDLAHPTFSPIARAIVARLPMLAVVAALMLPVFPAGIPEPGKLSHVEMAAPLDRQSVDQPARPIFCPPKDLRRLLNPSPCAR